MNSVKVKYHISRIAAAALNRLDDPSRLSLYIELMADAMLHAGYEIQPENQQREKDKLVSGTLELSYASLPVMRRLQRAGLSFSQIIEEALCYAFSGRLQG